MNDAHLVHEEPGSEEESDAKEDDGEVGEDGRVDGREIAGHGGQLGNSHHSTVVLCKYGNTVKLS